VTQQTVGGVGATSIESMRARIVELEETVSARDEFISMLGHELRNPLAPIFLQVTMMIERMQEAPGERIESSWLQPQLERFNARLEGFVLMLTRLMEFSKIRAGVVELQCEPMNLAEAVADVCERFERELATARIQLRTSLDHAVTGEWDRMRIEQITTNLVSNAIRYGGRNEIEVVVDASDGIARLVVQDHGPGIEVADQQRIFSRFDQGGHGAQAGQVRHTGGFGLGLWIVRRLCMAMGGQIDLESEPGEGARFIVSLPRNGGCA